MRGRLKGKPLAKHTLLRLDWVLITATLAAAGMGLPFLHSASQTSFDKQLVWLVVSLAAMGIAASINYRKLLDNAYVLYGISLVLLVIVLWLPPIRSARSWIRHPQIPIGLQPTEFMKIALILVLARHLRHRESQTTLRGLCVPLLLTLVPMALILKQPDLGSAILLPGLLFAVIYASGALAHHLAAIAATGVASAVPMWLYVMKSYQRRRILAFLHPEQYEAREAWQLIMSLIAIGSGGMYGEGLGQGTANALDLLPDKHTDFIFGVIAEEGGFVVAGSLLVLYMVIVLAGLNIAYNSREPGGRLIAVGCASLLGLQVLVNVGVVTALLPTTGITLPLVSYGGSSLVVTFAMIGLLLNVGMSQPIVVHETFTGPRPDSRI